MDLKTIAICIGASAAVGTLIFAVARYFWDRAESRAEWRGRTDESVTGLKTTLKRIDDSLRRLVEYLRPTAAVAETTGPMSLNERGKAVSDSLGAKEWAREKAVELSPGISGREAFEIYEFTKGYVEDDSHFDAEFQRQMRRTVYELSLEMTQVRTVLALELRDALL